MAEQSSSSGKKKRKVEAPVSVAEILGREQPFNLDAERGVLASIMLSPEICDEVIPLLKVEDFYDPAHARLYFHLTEMQSSGMQVDLMLLNERLATHGDRELVGGPAGLVQIFNSQVTPSYFRHYAQIVRQKSTVRALISACSDLMLRAYEPQEDSGKLLDEAEQRVFAIRESRHSSKLISLDKSLDEAIQRLELRLEGRDLEGNVDCGFKDLDALLGGFHASELIIIAARPSMGKTAFALNIAENVILKSQRPVLFISLEMAAIELTERLLCSVARVNSHRLRNGSLSKDDRQKLVRIAGEINQAKLFIDDTPSQTISEIAAAARRIKRQQKDLALIVVDYLQLIEPDNNSDPRQEQVARIARRMKGLAKELKVPVVCLAQLNRQAEDSRDHRPRLSHLRESGAIEQDADVVMFVHRKDYYRGGEDGAVSEEDQSKAQIIVAKQRNGPVGDVDVAWRRDFTRFEDLAPERFGEFDEIQAVDFG